MIFRTRPRASALVVASLLAVSANIASNAGAAAPKVQPTKITPVVKCVAAGKYRVSITAKHLHHSDKPVRYAAGNQVAAGDKQKAYTAFRKTSPTGNVTFPAFTYKHRAGSVPFFIQGLTSSTRVNVSFKLKLAACR